MQPPKCKTCGVAEHRHICGRTASEMRAIIEKPAVAKAVRAKGKPAVRAVEPDEVFDNEPQTETAALVRAIRERQGLSQSRFAAAYQFSLRTLQGWEQGVRLPPYVRVLLLVIDQAPEVVLAALKAKGGQP